jgi:hypothetical protein
VQSAFDAQAAHWPALQRAALALVQRVLSEPTHSQPPLGVPSQFASSPATVQESCAAGPTEPEQAPHVLVELLAPATHSCKPARQLP